MNEKELRELWRKACLSTEEIELRGELHPTDIKTIADWFIARIKERDEKLKEKIRYMKYPQPILGTPLHTEERMNAVNEILDDIINLIDNHA